MDRLPEHLIVLGGGYVGCEFAQMFRRFGSQVTLVGRSEAFLPREDRDVAQQVLEIFQEDGVDVLLGASTQQVQGLSGQSGPSSKELSMPIEIAHYTLTYDQQGRQENYRVLRIIQHLLENLQPRPSGPQASAWVG